MQKITIDDPDYWRELKPCPGCNQAIHVTIERPSYRRVVDEKLIISTGYHAEIPYVHRACFKCKTCAKPLDMNTLFHPSLLCHEHYFAEKFKSLNLQMQQLVRAQPDFQLLQYAIERELTTDAMGCSHYVTISVLVAEYLYCAPVYVMFHETSGKENETWTSFLQFQENQQNLSNLAMQLDYCSDCIEGDRSSCILDLNVLVPESAAKFIVQYHRINSYTDHQIINGKMMKIEISSLDFELPATPVSGGVAQYCSKRDKIKRTNLRKVDEVLSQGRISDYFVDQRSSLS